jgi:AhpD family alkylhydroperoxidase
MLTPVAPSTSNINDRLQCRRHLEAEEVNIHRPVRSTPNSPLQSGELVHLRANQINGCSVCVEMHARKLKEAGQEEQPSSKSKRN